MVRHDAAEARAPGVLPAISTNAMEFARGTIQQNCVRFGVAGEPVRGQRAARPGRWDWECIEW